MALIENRDPTFRQRLRISSGLLIAPLRFNRRHHRFTPERVMPDIDATRGNWLPLGWALARFRARAWPAQAT